MRVKQPAEPQTLRCPPLGVWQCPVVSLLGRPINSRSGVIICTQDLYSHPHLSPKEDVLFSLFKKVAKINLKVR